jgi:hypothetical protein
MKNETTQMTLFRQGWKAEVYFGSELTAHHLNTRSVYRFKENNDVSIIHSAPIVDGESRDKFVVELTEVLEYHKSGNVFRSQTQTVDTFDNWLDAYYCGVQCVNNLNSDILAAQC